MTYFPTDGDIEIVIGEQDSDVKESAIEVDPDPANWRVRDIYGNTVEAEVVLSDDKLTIKAPEGGYESGGIYVLDIGENAKFVGDGFGNSRHMVFGVDRGESETVVLNDNVYEIETDKVSISGEAVTVEGAYKESDILIGDFDGDGLNEAIGLVNIKEANGRTEAEYVSPTPEEVYKELDIFVAKYVDFAGGEFEEGIETGADQTGIAGLLGKFTDTVYAEEDKSNSESDEKLSGWDIGGKPGFRDSEINGETVSAPYLTITGGFKKDLVEIGFKIDTEVPILVVANKGVAYLDLEIRNNSTLDVNVGKELVIDPDKETDDEMLKKFEENKNAPKQELGGKKDIKKDIDIPLGPTGSIIKELLNIRVDVFSEVGVDLSAQFKNNLTADASLYMRAWYVYKGSESGGYESGFEHSISAVMTNDLSGKVELFAGLGLRLSAGYPALVEFNAEGAVGPYADINGAVHAETKFSTPPNDFDFDWRGMLSVEGGVKAKASVNAMHDGWGLFIEDFDKELLNVEGKFPVISESTPKPILSIGIKDSYAVNDGKLRLDDIDVTYIDMILDEEETVQLQAGAYEVYVDGNKISDLNNLGSNEASIGKHALKLAWKHDGHDYEYEKEVEFVEGAQVAWVLEPTDKYSDIGQLEMRTYKFKEAAKQSGVPFYGDLWRTCINNKIGYPQEWGKGEARDGSEISYNPNAFAVANSNNGNWGIMDYDGNILLQPQIAEASSGGLGVPFKNPSWYSSRDALGYYGTTYDEFNVLSGDYSSVLYTFTNFSGGGVPGAEYVINAGELYHYNKSTGEFERVAVPDMLKDALVPTTNKLDSSLAGGWMPMDGRHYAYIDVSGRIIEQENTSFSIGHFVNGYYSAVESSYVNGEYRFSEDEKLAIFKASTGKAITDFIYEDALYFEEGLCPVSRDGKWGFIDESGREVTEMLFDKASTVYDGKAAVIIDGKFAIINIKDSIAGGILTKEIMDDAIASAEAKVAEELANRKSDKRFPEDYVGEYEYVPARSLYVTIALYKDGTVKGNISSGGGFGSVPEFDKPKGTLDGKEYYYDYEECPFTGKFSVNREVGFNAYEIELSDLKAAEDFKEWVVDDPEYPYRNVINPELIEGAEYLTKVFTALAQGADASIVPEEARYSYYGNPIGDNVEMPIYALYNGKSALFTWRRGVLDDNETNEVLNAIRGTWADIDNQDYQYVLNGLNLTLTGFDSTYNNDPSGYKTRGMEISPDVIDGREAYIINVPYSDSIRLWSLVIYKDDIKNGKCERIYARYRGGYSFTEAELKRIN